MKILIYKSIFGNYDNNPHLVKDFSLVKDGETYDFEHILVSNSYGVEFVNGWKVEKKEATIQDSAP